VTKLLKRYGDALAQVISSQSEEVTDLRAYFRGVDVTMIPKRHEQTDDLLSHHRALR